MTSTQKIVVMGVSGSGKTMMAQRLASILGLAFYDADDFHNPMNIAKMTQGIPLNDADRAGWLNDLAGLIQHESSLVLACSALKSSYRARLKAADPRVRFLYLKGSFDVIWPRLQQREHHYFNGKDMLHSQFSQLEEPQPEEARIIDVSASPEEVLSRCLAGLR